MKIIPAGAGAFGQRHWDAIQAIECLRAGNHVQLEIP